MLVLLMAGSVAVRLVLFGQIDNVVGEPKRDFWRRKIGVVKGLREDHVIVAVLYGDRAGVVGVDGEFPDLKGLFGHPYLGALGKSDFVEKPVGAALIGDVSVVINPTGTIASVRSAKNLNGRVKANSNPRSHR